MYDRSPGHALRFWFQINPFGLLLANLSVALGSEVTVFSNQLNSLIPGFLMCEENEETPPF